MILPTDKNFSNINVLIFGLGLHGGGVESAIWFLKHKANVTVTDIKTRDELKTSIKKLRGYKIKYSLQGHKESDILSSDIIIQNPGAPSSSPYLRLARKKGIPIHNVASIFFYYCPSIIIGITGTRGKSTTAYLTWLMLKKKYKNALLAGLPNSPILSILDKCRANNYVVIELSSWQLEALSAVKKSPQIAVITNIYEDHLNRHKGMEDYIDAKWNILRWQTPQDLAVLNADSLKLRTKFLTQSPKSSTHWVTIKEVLPSLNHIKKSYLAKGEHNLYNLAFSAFIAHHLGVSSYHIMSVAKIFSGLKGRQELIRSANGVAYYNDTTSTTPIACVQALNTLGDRKRAILIAGGVDKNLDYTDMAKTIDKKAKAVIMLPGTASAKILEGLKQARYKGEIMMANDLKQAVTSATMVAIRGDTVIFSPGAASFNLFVNEYDRGDKFDKIVVSL